VVETVPSNPNYNRYTISSIRAGEYYEGGKEGALVGTPIWRIVSRAGDTPPPFGEMSDAEQGALLLAAHRGEVIELHAGCFGWIEWDGVGSLFEAHQPVRVRPAITRHPLTVNGQHVGTVAMQDGKVLPDSVEWGE